MKLTISALTESLSPTMLPMLIGSILLPFISASLEQVHTDLNANAPRYNKDLCDLVDIQSISSLKEHQPDLAKAAQWLTARLKEAGLEVCSSCAGTCEFIAGRLCQSFGIGTNGPAQTQAQPA